MVLAAWTRERDGKGAWAPGGRAVPFAKMLAAFIGLLLVWPFLVCGGALKSKHRKIS